MGEMRLKVLPSTATGSWPHDLMATVHAFGTGGRVAFTREVAVEASRAMAARIDLPNGSYMVQVSLPSGEILRDWFEVEEERPAEVVLRARGRPRGSDDTNRQPVGGEVGRTDGERSDPRPYGEQGGYGAAAEAEAIASYPYDFRAADAEAVAGITYIKQPVASAREAWRTMGRASHGGEVIRAWDPSGSRPAGIRGKRSANKGTRIQPKLRIGRQGQARRWAVAADADELLLISLPLPWPSRQDGHQAPMYLAAGHRRTDVPGHGLSISIADGALGGLLEYLGRGRLDGAARFLGEIDITTLVRGDEPWRNPLGACAAAYVGLTTLDPGETPDWLRSLPELASANPWLPDAAVLVARRLYQSEVADVASISAALKRAFDCGVPYYTVGIMYLREMLWTCSSRDPELGEILDAVTRVASRIDNGKVFTTLRYPHTVRKTVSWGIA